MQDLTESVKWGGPPWIDGDVVVLQRGNSLRRYVIGSVEEHGFDWIIRDMVLDPTFNEEEFRAGH